jgi:hypothetical protein
MASSEARNVNPFSGDQTQMFENFGIPKEKQSIENIRAFIKIWEQEKRFFSQLIEKLRYAENHYGQRIDNLQRENEILTTPLISTELIHRPAFMANRVCRRINKQLLAFISGTSLTRIKAANQTLLNHYSQKLPRQYELSNAMEKYIARDIKITQVKAITGIT